MKEARKPLVVKIPPKRVTNRCLKCAALTGCATHGVENLAKTLPERIAKLRAELAAVKKCHRRGERKR